MKARVESKLDQRIVEQLHLAGANLGADPISFSTVTFKEMYRALERLGAPADLLAIAGSWGDGLPWTEDDDARTLALLRDWNAENRVARPAQVG